MIVKKEATYVLMIKISENCETSVGGLGKILFKKGDYVYIGSAKGCLQSRLRRHLRKEKKIYWHIDYLLKSEKSKVFKVWVIKKSFECETTRIFLKYNIVDLVKKGFGSSDCRCLTHFFN